MFTSFTLRGSVLALVLAAGTSFASFASADTTYHATIDTSSMSGAGWLDMAFQPGQVPTVGAAVTLSHFSGNFGSEVELEGDASGALPGSFTMVNSTDYNDVFQALTLGGSFSFDISFSGAYETTSGSAVTTLAVGLLSDDGAYLGNPDGILFQIELTPLKGSSPLVLAPDVATLTAITAAVPEPSEYLLLLGGLCVLGAVTARRRSAR